MKNNSGCRVALIEPVGGHGGMNYYDLGLSRGLISSGCDVHWYTSNSTNEESEKGLRIHKFFLNIYSKKIPSLLRGLLFVFGLILSLVHSKFNRCSIVHLHYFHYTKLEWLTIHLVRLFGFKYVVTVHDVQSFIEGDSDKYAVSILSNASSLIVHNKYSLEVLQSKAKRLSITLPNIDVIPHGNYLPFITQFDVAHSRRLLSLPEDKKVLLFFGQIKKVKGLDVLITALSKLNRDDYVLVIAGKVWKDSWDSYQQHIDESGIGKRVVSEIRYIDDSEVDLFFSSADFVVLPYREIFQSGVLLMAMSYGSVPVVSDIRGMTDIVNDKRNGFVFESGSAESLAKVLNAILEIDSLSSYKECIFDEISSNYDWNRVGALTHNVYKKLY